MGGIILSYWEYLTGRNGCFNWGYLTYESCGCWGCCSWVFMDVFTLIVLLLLFVFILVLFLYDDKGVD